MRTSINFIIFFIPQLMTVLASEFNCSAPPNLVNFDINSCCRLPEINLGTVPQDCNKKIEQLKISSQTELQHYPAYAHLCYPECIYQQTGAMVNDEIQIENVKSFLKQNVHQRDQDIVPHIVNSFETCLKNITGHMHAVGLKKYKKLSVGCSPFASMLYSCVNAETFSNCPAQMWKNEEHCIVAKNFVQKCNPLPHVPLPIS